MLLSVKECLKKMPKMPKMPKLPKIYGPPSAARFYCHVSILLQTEQIAIQRSVKESGKNFT